MLVSVKQPDLWRPRCPDYSFRGEEQLRYASEIVVEKNWRCLDVTHSYFET
jgi:hypothetical protein